MEPAADWSNKIADRKVELPNKVSYNNGNT